MEPDWSNVLLTSSGWWRTFSGGVRGNIRNCFLSMLKKPPESAKVLFIPAAALDGEARRAAQKCRDELLSVGISPENLVSYDLDVQLPEGQVMGFDAVYLTGGDTAHLLKRLRETRFDAVLKNMVYRGKVYVGVSAGSIAASAGIGGPGGERGLGLLKAYLSVHCPSGSMPRTDLPLPHIPLTDDQALAVSRNGFRLIED